jgi:hypothetical protein
MLSSALAFSWVLVSCAAGCSASIPEERQAPLNAEALEETVFRALRENDPSVLEHRLAKIEELAYLHVRFPHRVMFGPTVLETSELRPMPPRDLARLAKEWGQKSRDSISRAIRQVHAECKGRGLQWPMARLAGAVHPIKYEVADGVGGHSWDARRCLQIDDGNLYVLIQVDVVNQEKSEIPSKYAEVLGESSVPTRTYIGGTVHPLQFLGLCSSGPSGSMMAAINLTHPYHDQSVEIWIGLDGELPAGNPNGIKQLLHSLYSSDFLGELIPKVRIPIIEVLADQEGAENETKARLSKAITLAQSHLNEVGTAFLARRKTEVKGVRWTLQVKVR